MFHNPLTGWQWLRRLALGLLALLFVLCALWGVWYWEMVRRCDAAIAQYRARGERVLVSEFPVNDIPDEQNALCYVLQAGKTIMPPVPANRMKWPGRYTAADVTNHAQAFDLLRKARQCTRTSTSQSGTAATPQPFINVSELARLAGDAALLAHAQGDERTAIERWRDGDTIARAFADRSPLLISGLIATIINGIDTSVMLALAPTLRISDTDGLPFDDAHKLIRELEQDTFAADTCAQGFLGDRAALTNAYLTGLFPSGPWPLRPMRLYYMLHGWESMTDCAREAREPGHVATNSPPTRDAEVATDGAIPQFTNAGGDARHGVLLRRFAAATVAIQLYHAKTGLYPQNLQQLVPVYLAHVPLDPCTAELRPLGYSLEADGQRPVLWCAGTSPASEQQIRRGIPTRRVSAPTSRAPFGTVTYFDASGWDAAAAVLSTQQRGAHQHQ